MTTSLPSRGPQSSAANTQAQNKHHQRKTPSRTSVRPPSQALQPNADALLTPSTPPSPLKTPSNRRYRPQKSQELPSVGSVGGKRDDSKAAQDVVSPSSAAVAAVSKEQSTVKPVVEVKDWAELAEEELGDPAIMSSFPLRAPPSEAQLAKKARQKAKQKEKQQAKRASKASLPVLEAALESSSPNNKESAVRSNSEPDTKQTEMENASSVDRQSSSASTAEKVHSPLSARMEGVSPAGVVSPQPSHFHGVFRGGRSGLHSAPLRDSRQSSRAGQAASFAASQAWEGNPRWKGPRSMSMSPSSSSDWPKGVEPPLMPRAQREAMERRNRQQKLHNTAHTIGMTASNSETSHSGRSTPATTVVSSPIIQSMTSLPSIGQPQKDISAAKIIAPEDAHERAGIHHERASTLSGETSNPAACADGGLPHDCREEAVALVSAHGMADAEDGARKITIKLPLPATALPKSEPKPEESARLTDFTESERALGRTQESSVGIPAVDADSFISLPLPVRLPIGFAIDSEGQVWDLSEGFANKVSHFSSPAVQQILRSSAPTQSSRVKGQDPPAPASTAMPRSVTQASSNIPRSAVRAAAFRPSGSLLISGSDAEASPRHHQASYAGPLLHVRHDSLQQPEGWPSHHGHFPPPPMSTDGMPILADQQYYDQHGVGVFYDTSLPPGLYAGPTHHQDEGGIPLPPPPPISFYQNYAYPPPDQAQAYYDTLPEQPHYYEHEAGGSSHTHTQAMIHFQGGPAGPAMTTTTTTTTATPSHSTPSLHPSFYQHEHPDSQSSLHAFYPAPV